MDYAIGILLSSSRPNVREVVDLQALATELSGRSDVGSVQQFNLP